MLKLRAQARAILFYACEYADLEEAIAPLRALAAEFGPAGLKIVYAAFGLLSDGDAAKNQKIEIA